MSNRDQRPIAILHEHPDWFRPLFAELERRDIPYVRLDAASLAWDPSERDAPYALVFNRASPSAYLRGHGTSLFHTLHWLTHVQRLGVPVVNGTDAYALELSKATQLDLLASLGLPFPRSRVINDPARAVEELKYAREKLGLVGIFWRPNKFCGRTMASPDYYPVYDVASELGVTVCVHEGARTVLPQAGGDRYSEFGRHVACHPLEQMLACLNFCADGVLEKFPKLKVAHLESGCGWVPFWLERMDEHWEHESHGSAKITKEKPSYYFKRNCWVSCEAGEELAPVFIEHVGDDYLMIATDYPHSDAIDKFPDKTVGAISSNDKIAAQSRRKILWDNPTKTFGLGA